MPIFTPLDDQVLIRRDPPETITTGGLHLPERDVVRPLRGTVLAAGPGRWRSDVDPSRYPKGSSALRVPLSVSPGEVVLYGRYAGTEVRFDGQDCLVLRESEILGVIGEDAVDWEEVRSSAELG